MKSTLSWEGAEGPCFGRDRLSAHLASQLSDHLRWATCCNSRYCVPALPSARIPVCSAGPVVIPHLDRTKTEHANHEKTPLYCHRDHCRCLDSRSGSRRGIER